jgi:CBS domain-containing protein
MLPPKQKEIVMGFRDYGGDYPTAHQEPIGQSGSNVANSKTLARDIMSTKVHCTDPDSPILELAEKLESLKISGMPVVDQQGTLVGIISEKDTFKLILQQTFTQSLAGIVSDYMSKSVETLTPEDDLFKIADLFYTKSFRRLPVIENSQVVGLVSRRDVLKALNQMGA